MSRTLTAQDRSSLIRLASSLPSGSPERKAILAALSRVSSSQGLFEALGELEDLDMMVAEKVSAFVDHPYLLSVANRGRGQRRTIYQNKLKNNPQLTPDQTELLRFGLKVLRLRISGDEVSPDTDAAEKIEKSTDRLLQEASKFGLKVRRAN